ncbi:MAG: class I SAM-dependent methyltransferase [Actinomycetota bacterium]
MAPDSANADMANAWAGESEHWVMRADRYDAGITPHQQWMFRAAAIAPHERVLDIGCGCGASTLEAARAARSGSAHGVDLAEPMLALARTRARDAGLSNATFEHADAQVAKFDDEPFDVAISRFGVMFFADPITAFANIARALRPGGRLSILSWQLVPGSGFLILRNALAAGRELPSPPPNAPGPFGFATEDHIRRVLTDAGFADITLVDVREPVWLGADVDDAFAFASKTGMARGLLEELEPVAADAALASLRGVLERYEGADGVALPSAAWSISARTS